MKAIHIVFISIGIMIISGCLGKSKEKDNHATTILDKNTKQIALSLPKALEKYQENIEKSIMPFIRITGKIQSTKPWESKFSGNPYFPVDMTYPKDSQNQPMKLLAQINFAEVSDMSMFPQSGILEFFISTHDDIYGMNFDNPTKQENFRVIYIEEVIKDTSKIINDFNFVKVPHEFYFPIAKEARLSFSIEYQPVSVDDFRFKNYFTDDSYTFFEQFKNEQDELFEFYAEAFSGTGHKLGGYAFFTQTDPRFYDNPEYEMLLLQIDSDDNLEIMWGDVGVANFFIRKKDLENKSFSDVLYNWDCY